MAMEYSTIDTLNAKGMFEIAVKVNDVYRIQNVLGIALEKLSNSPVTKEQLEYIGATSVEYAKELLIEQGAVDTHKAYRGIKYRMPSERRLEIFDDATAVRTGYPYPASIEYGYHPYGKDKYIPPRPFLRPAIKYAQLLTKYSIQDAVQRMFQGDNWTNIGFFGGSQKFDVGRKINLSKNNKGSFSSHAGYKAMSGIRGRNMQRYVRKNGGERHITKLPALSNGQHRFWGFKQHPSRTSVSKASEISGYKRGAYAYRYSGLEKYRK